MMSRNGFTLLELLVAAALIAVVSLVVASAFFAGFQVWKRASRQGEGETLLAFEMLRKDLHNTVPSRLAVFKGGENWIEIPALVTGIFKEGGQDVPGVIRYEHDAESSGLARVTRYFRFPETGDTVRDVLPGTVDAVTFSYFDRAPDGAGPGSWGTGWAGKTNAPGAVKMAMVVRQGDERIELERTIILPCR